MASSSSSSSTMAIRPHKYGVFLSFRGTDTRNGFLGHLYRALIAKGIKTYIDEHSLERGDEIAISLVEAIRDSMASVVLLSENYASSWWCLDELVHILNCRQSYGQIVVPVFYGVEPTHVRKQEDKFGVAFSKLKLSERFRNDGEKIRSWTEALSRIADLSGWDSSVIRSEAEMLDGIVNDVKRKLERKSKPRNRAKGLVGIEERVEKVKSLLCITNQETLTIGIWGMGGIGKTTLAKEVFDELCSDFEGCCFLENVREEWENGKEEKLRNKLHSKLLNEENPYNAEERLSIIKAFIVLDDINDQEQLEFLIEDCSRFGNGSRVIVTTRDMQMLRYLEADDMLYKVEELNQHEALELFLTTAFRNKSHTDLDTNISDRVVSYAQGVPLAIKVLGSYLRCKKKENWKIEMDKLEQSPNNKIQNVLKVSYDGLDVRNKEIFLDLACFFKGQFRDDVEPVLDGCGFFAQAGIDDLIEKSLVTIRNSSQIWMHDLIQEMGREIVNSFPHREERTRLWIGGDVVHVLKHNIGSKAIEGIFLDTTKIEDVELSPAVFKPMHNLRLLKIKDRGERKLHFPQDLHALPDMLRYLNWNSFPMKSLPPKFTPHNLVELDMPNSQLCELWDGVQDLANLKHIVLSNSKNLTRIPDLSRARNLESLHLRNCTSLVQIPPLRFQTPEKRSHFSSHKYPGTLHLNGCSSLEALPTISGYVTHLDLRNTAVRELSTTNVQPDNLIMLLLENSKLSHLPSSVGLMEDLRYISLSFSSLFNEFPKELPRNIVQLDLSRTVIENVPSSIERVSGTLMGLSLNNCKRLKSLPRNIYKLKKLETLGLYGCSNLEEFPEKFPPNLKILDASRCTSLARVSNSETLAHVFWSDYQYWPSKQFRFCECTKLDENAKRNILIEYQIRILHTATMSMVHRHEDSDVTICFPGNEIPQWFKSQSEGPSITINLPENWHSTDFIGFALCVCGTFEESKFNITCSYYYSNINNSKSHRFWHIAFSKNAADNPILGSDHLFMSYIDKNHWHFLDAAKITFEFKYSLDEYNYSPCDNKVNRCGVRLLNWQDAEKFGIAKEAQLESCESVKGLIGDSDFDDEYCYFPDTE